MMAVVVNTQPVSQAGTLQPSFPNVHGGHRNSHRPDELGPRARRQPLPHHQRELQRRVVAYRGSELAGGDDKMNPAPGCAEVEPKIAQSAAADRLCPPTHLAAKSPRRITGRDRISNDKSARLPSRRHQVQVRIPPLKHPPSQQVQPSHLRSAGVTRRPATRPPHSQSRNLSPLAPAIALQTKLLPPSCLRAPPVLDPFQFRRFSVTRRDNKFPPCIAKQSHHLPLSSPLRCRISFQPALYPEIGGGHSVPNAETVN